MSKSISITPQKIYYITALYIARWEVMYIQEGMPGTCCAEATEATEDMSRKYTVFRCQPTTESVS